MRHPLLRYYLERVLRDMGGISLWAAKFVTPFLCGTFSVPDKILEFPDGLQGQLRTCLRP